MPWLRRLETEQQEQLKTRRSEKVPQWFRKRRRDEILKQKNTSVEQHPYGAKTWRAQGQP